MTIYFSKTTGGFYDDAIHGAMPGDAVEITAEQHAALLAGQGAGQRIVGDSGGNPVLADPEPLTPEELSAMARAERDRLITQTDYLLMPDYPISEDDLIATKMYRQALRDVPAQPGFPVDIEWPQKPI